MLFPSLGRLKVQWSLTNGSFSLASYNIGGSLDMVSEIEFSTSNALLASVTYAFDAVIMVDRKAFWDGVVMKSAVRKKMQRHPHPTPSTSHFPQP